MPDQHEIKVRAVVFREGDWWIAQFLEYGLVTAQKRLEDIPGEIRRVLTVLIQGSLARGVEPFFGYRPAPRRFWKMYEQATALTGTSSAGELPANVEIETRIAA
jgi:hypothetical protein